MFLRCSVVRSFTFTSSKLYSKPLVSYSAAGPAPPPTTRLLSTTSAKMAQEFKLKGLSKLGLKNGDKQECEVEGIEGGKVLVVKSENVVTALNANCTHFGAPLKNGVLTSNGRLTCPWHGGRSSTITSRKSTDLLQLVSMSRPAMSRMLLPRTHSTSSI